MSRHKSRAFVLNVAEFREHSRLLHLLCEKEGVIGMIARGVYGRKSLQAAASDLFSLVQATYMLKEDDTLATALTFELEKSYSCLRDDLEKYALANFWFEIVRFGFQSRVSSVDVFEQTMNFLNELEGRAVGSPVIWGRFLILFQILGFGLRLGKCARCGGSDDLNCFDPAHGCLFCRNCVSQPRGMLPLDRDFRQALEWVAAAGDFEPEEPDFDLSTRQQGQLAELIFKYASIQLDRPFKSGGFLNQVFVIGGRTGGGTVG